MILLFLVSTLKSTPPNRLLCIHLRSLNPGSLDPDLHPFVRKWSDLRSVFQGGSNFGSRSFLGQLTKIRWNGIFFFNEIIFTRNLNLDLDQLNFYEKDLEKDLGSDLRSNKKLGFRSDFRYFFCEVSR